MKRIMVVWSWIDLKHRRTSIPIVIELGMGFIGPKNMAVGRNKGV
jgi:hypothetical protein